MNMWDPAGLTIAFAITIVAFCAYITGCVHQWTRHGLARRAAFCAGYDKASHALLVMVETGQPLPSAGVSGPVTKRRTAPARDRGRGSPGR